MQRDIDLVGKNKVYIDMDKIPKNCIIVISNNKAKVRILPKFGEYKVVVHNGEVRRMNFSEGEEF